MKSIPSLLCILLVSSAAFADRFECQTVASEDEKYKVEVIDGDFPYTRVAKEFRLIDDKNRVLIDAVESVPSNAPKQQNDKVLTGSAANTTVDIQEALRSEANAKMKNIVVAGKRINSWAYAEFEVGASTKRGHHEFSFGDSGEVKLKQNPYQAVLKLTQNKTGTTSSASIETEIDLVCNYVNASVKKKS